MLQENFISHWITGKTIDSKVFETWYFDVTLDIWSMTRPDVRVCDCKYVEYYVIDGNRYDSLDAAEEAMARSVCIPAVLEMDESEVI